MYCDANTHTIGKMPWVSRSTFCVVVISNVLYWSKSITIEIWSYTVTTRNLHSIALTDLRIRGRGARWSSKPRRAWAWGRSRRAAGPAEADEWTLYQPRETERWWAPLASSWRTSAAAEPPAVHRHSVLHTCTVNSFIYSSRRRTVKTVAAMA